MKVKTLFWMTGTRPSAAWVGGWPEIVLLGQADAPVLDLETVRGAFHHDGSVCRGQRPRADLGR